MKKIVMIYYAAAVLLVSLLTVGCASDSADLYVDDTDESTGESSGGSSSSWSDPDGAIEWIDELLSWIYLYNDEYNELDRDYSLDYYDFFYGNLTSLTTNTLDYKGEEGAKILFSYIEATAPDGSTRSSDSVATDYGFLSLGVATDSTGSIGIYIMALYADSPAAAAGLERGMVILDVDGEQITTENYSEIGNSLYYPTEGESHTFYVYVHNGANKTVTVKSSSYSPNPVLKAEIIDEDSSVGYLNYQSFNSSFDSQMLTGFKTLKDSGAESLILDLRYNLGGYVSSASKMVSAITGTSAGSGTIFSCYRFNDTLTEERSYVEAMLGCEYDSTLGLFREELSGVASQYQLALTNNTIYCLVSYATASASEMVINSLRGMGYDVVLIGRDTRGKNVGMLVMEKSFEGYTYTAVPVTFENFNSLGEGGYEDGFEVAANNEISLSEEMAAYDSDFSTSDPMIALALQYIKGKSIRSVATRMEDLAESEFVATGDVLFSQKQLQGALQLAK